MALIIRNSLSCIILLLIGQLSATAQERTFSPFDSTGVEIYFRRGYAVLEQSLNDNGKRLNTFIEQLRTIQQDTSYIIRSVHFSGSASPDGNDKMNEKLAEKRASVIVEYLRTRILLPDSLINISPRGVDWQRLSELVRSSDMPHKDKVLDIILNTPLLVIRNGVITDSRRRQLEMLDGGRPYRYMYDNLFPRLRSSGVVIKCEIERITPPRPELCREPIPDVDNEGQTTARQQPAATTGTDTIPSRLPETARAASNPTSKPLHMALKTNMLFDAALIPNIGIEIYLGHGWSAAGNWMYAWWKNDRSHYYWRTYGGDAEIRKWLGRRHNDKPLTGHHIGAYGQILTYDIETGGRGYLGDRWSWGAGLSYGYSHPIWDRLNIDFTVGLGYLGGKYKEYVPLDGCYVWQTTKKRRWIGPTKAEISLSWLITHQPASGKKGARR